MSGEQPVLLEIEGLRKHFPVTRGAFRKVVGAVKAVDDVSLFVRRGETLGLVGESGCGKTTLGKCIVRLQKPTAGRMRYRFPDGTMKDLLSLDRRDGFDVRRKIQIVFQDPYSSLNPMMTILDSFDEPLRVHGMKDESARRERIASLLESVSLNADYMYRYPHEFSGGQRQRICIARALSIEPELVVCDEPVSALDVSIQAQVLNLLKDLQARMGLTFVFIAHDLSVVEYMSDRIAVMYLGRVVELAGSKELYRDHRHPYTEALLSAILSPRLDGKKQRIILKGDVPSPASPPSGCHFHPRCWKCTDRCRTEEPELRPMKGSPEHFVACHLSDTEREAR